MTFDPVALYKRTDRAVRGWPEAILTGALVAIGIFCILVAMSDKAALKGIVVAWMVLP